MKRSCLVSFALGVALAGCGSSDDPPPGVYANTLKRYPVPGCESFDPAPCDVLHAACQARLLGLAACLRGSEPGELLPVSILSEEEFRQALEEEAAADEPEPDLEHWDAAFTELGLIAPGGFSAESQIEQTVTFVGAYYSPESQSIVVIDHGGTADAEEASVTLLHEYVHALQDRDVDLASFSDVLGGDFEANVAFRSLVEGEARFHELHYAASAFGFDPASVDWDALFENGVETTESELFAQDSVLTTAQLAFPYVWGSRYIHHTWPKSGHSGILGRYATPAVSTRALLASKGQAAADDFSPTLFESPVPSADYELVGVDTLGGFGTFLLFGLHAAKDEAHTLADAWRGDRLSIYAPTDTGRDATALVWTCDFASEEVAAVASTRLSQQYGSGVRREDTRVTLALSTNGASLEWAFALPDP